MANRQDHIKNGKEFVLSLCKEDDGIILVSFDIYISEIDDYVTKYILFDEFMSLVKYLTDSIANQEKN